MFANNGLRTSHLAMQMMQVKAQAEKRLHKELASTDLQMYRCLQKQAVSSLQ